MLQLIFCECFFCCYCYFRRLTCYSFTIVNCCVTVLLIVALSCNSCPSFCFCASRSDVFCIPEEVDCRVRCQCPYTSTPTRPTVLSVQRFYVSGLICDRNCPLLIDGKSVAAMGQFGEGNYTESYRRQCPRTACPRRRPIRQ